MLLATEYQPKSILEEFVVCFYYNRSEDFEYLGHVHPTIYPELFFNLGDQFELQHTNGHITSQRNWISGLQSKSAVVKTSGKHLTAGVIFKPWGLYAAFGMNAKELYNKTADSGILYDFGKELSQADIPAIHFFDLMEKSLIRSLKKCKLTGTMRSIIHDLERENLDVLSAKLNRSKKSIIHSFNQMLGISPQKFYILQSICEAIAVLQENPNIQLTELAYRQGFYDQSHFIRTFKKHTGLTPTAYRSKNTGT